MTPFDLREHDVTVTEIHRNLPPGALYEHAIRYEKGASIADNGALVAYSGAKTGRSPKDKRVVKHPASEGDVWWGTVNIPLDPAAFAINRERARDYLNTRERLYCFDGFAGWDPSYRIKIRVIVDAIHSGALARAARQEDTVFGFDVITECPGVPAEILVPRITWADQAAFDAAARKLGGLFRENFRKYEAGASAEVRAAGPA